jgi:hypothetical protein
MMSIRAPQGVGKSSLGVKITFDFFGGNWEAVRAHMTFDLRSIVPRMQWCLDHDRIMPICTFDDATLPFSKYLQFQKGGFQHIDKINKFITLARDICHYVVMISVSEDVISELRKKAWIRTNINDITFFCGVPLRKEERVARSYRVSSRPDGKEMITKLYADIYPLMYYYAPPEFLSWYKEERKKATQGVLKSLAESLLDEGGFAPTAEDIIAHESWTEARKSFAKGCTLSATKGCFFTPTEYRTSVLQTEAWLVRKQKATPRMVLDQALEVEGFDGTRET